MAWVPPEYPTSPAVTTNLAPAVLADWPISESMAACPVFRLLANGVDEEYSVSPRSPTTSKVRGVEPPAGSRVVKVWVGLEPSRSTELGPRGR